MGKFMCGICACIGEENQIKNALESLQKLEYRGYDSAGLAFKTSEGLECIKSVGEIEKLKQKLDKLNPNSSIVIGHTRWATHGGVCEKNAHPHFSKDGEIALVHNGIVENFELLKKQMPDIDFVSDTDSEVFANLIEQKEGVLLERVIEASKEVVGSYAVAVMSKEGDCIVLARRESPLYVAKTEKFIEASSDIITFFGKAKEYYCLGDNEFAVMDKSGVNFYNKNGKLIEKSALPIKENCEECKIYEKYHMQAEIKETKKVIQNTLDIYFSENSPLKKLKRVKKFNSFVLIGCGTAYHSCLMGEFFIKKIAKRKAYSYIASEFRYNTQILDKKCLYIFVSQSGETADTVGCARMLSSLGYSCLSVSNTEQSMLNQICKYTLPTFAGKEIAVASTKAYTAQVLALKLFSYFISGVLNVKKEELFSFAKQFEILEADDELAKKICAFEKIFFIGRGEDFVTSMEASLKLKEISYINCSSVPAGELKHGTLALIDDKSLVVTICTDSQIQDKIKSNVKEILARGGHILLLASKNFVEADYFTELPKIHGTYYATVFLQSLAYKVCLQKGLNPDKPRNLAKSVTVE